MLPRLLAALLSLSLSAALSPAQEAPAAKRDFNIPASAYTSREIAGWQVRVNNTLLNERAEAGQSALDLLTEKLEEVANVVPPATVESLRRVPIWLGVDDHDKPNAVYHPSADWLRSHGFNPAKARAVEIPNAAVFINWSDTQPMIVLHEMAHAFHHQVIGHDHAGLLAAFERAKSSGTYDNVAYAKGKPRRAYALNNVQEFFAELSEAYFGRNDFFPFTRAELQEHDPDAFALLEKLWGVQ